MVPCICIDSSGKPEEIIFKEWIEKGKQYHITYVVFHPLQGINGVYLKEVSLSEKSHPFETYKITRFGFTKENLERMKQMVIDTHKIAKIDIDELFEKSEIEILQT